MLPQTDLAPSRVRSRRRRQTVDVELLGQHLTVVSDADEAAIRAVVAYVDDRLQTIARRTPKRPNDEIALLAALNIAEELFEDRKKDSALRERIAGETRELASILDALERDLDDDAPTTPFASADSSAGATP